MAAAMKKLLADLFLLWRALFVQPLRRLRDGGPRGEAKFLANYAGERLVPTSPEDRVMLAAAARCIGCGLCDELGGRLRGASGGPSLVPLQYARSSVELPHARREVEAIEPRSYAEAEAACPTRVPLQALAGWIKERLARTLALGAGPT